jgi:hypothetical protein
MSSKEKLYSEVAAESGVSSADVRKVLAVLGIDKHFDEAVEHLGEEPTLKEIFVAYRISKSAVVV